MASRYDPRSDSDADRRARKAVEVVVREIEDGAWPFVISVIPPAPDEAFFGRFFAKQAELLARKEHWVHLCDIRMVTKLPDARIRNLIAERSRELDPLSARYTVAAAVVIDNALVRGILTAIQWISRPPSPSIVAATPREAIAFLESALIRQNVPLPKRMSPDLVELVAGRVAPASSRRSISP